MSNRRSTILDSAIAELRSIQRAIEVYEHDAAALQEIAEIVWGKSEEPRAFSLPQLIEAVRQLHAQVKP